MHMFRHLSEKQRIVNRIIASSNCWAGINDLRAKYTALSARDDLKHKKTRQKSGMYSMKAYKEY